MSLAATLFLLPLPLLQPQNPPKLPPLPEKQGQVAPVQRPASEIERFRRDLLDLSGSTAKVEQKLLDIGQGYPALEALVIEVARNARANEMTFLMHVARRYGTGKIADELKFQLMTRPLAEATRPVVDTMVALLEQKGQDARPALRDLVKGRVPSARRPATETLAQKVTADDLPFAMELSSDPTLDLQLRGVDLLRAVPAPAARERLVALLSKDPALAAAACEALISLQKEAVPFLQKLVGEPPIDRGFCYAAFALAQIGDAIGQPVLDDKVAPALLTRLGEREPLTRALAGIPLADLAWRSAPGGNVAWRDVDIVDALLDLVDSRQFVPNLDLLRRPAEQRLVRFTGRLVVTGEALGWREWWKTQRDGFLGLRARVAVTEQNAGDTVVAFRQERLCLRLLAENLADLPPLPGTQEVLLTRAQMLELTAQLQKGGFGDAVAMSCPTGLPLVRALQLQVGGARMQVAMPAGEHAAFDALVASVQKVVDSELWQLYRNPATEADRGAFWRAERKWLDGNPDPIARGRRLVRRVFQDWTAWTPALRARALEHLFLRADRRQLLGEEDGERIVAVVDAAPELGELELHLLELAAGVPGDKVWRQCVDLAARKQGGGRQAVRAVFAVLGPDAVLAALQDQRPVVRRVALDEVVVTRDLRAAQQLVALLGDGDLEVQRSAAYACGQLQVAAADKGLIALIAAPGTVPLVRREALRSLGRVGGEQAFAVLDRAMTSPNQEDKEAALKGLGELKDPRAAHLLTEFVVVGKGKDLGDLAGFYLQRLGAALVVPALRQQLEIQKDTDVRARLVLLLGGYQDVRVIPDLIDLLHQPAYQADAAVQFAGTTGFDLLGQQDRIGAAEIWWRKNRQNPQWQWLLDGLRAKEVTTVLGPQDFAAGAGLQPVPELIRVLIECNQPHLCVLASAVLRTLTNEDFGVVTLTSSKEAREAIGARYRLFYEAQKTAQAK